MKQTQNISGKTFIHSRECCLRIQWHCAGRLAEILGAATCICPSLCYSPSQHQVAKMRWEVRSLWWFIQVQEHKRWDNGEEALKGENGLLTTHILILWIRSITRQDEPLFYVEYTCMQWLSPSLQSSRDQQALILMVSTCSSQQRQSTLTGKFQASTSV